MLCSLYEYILFFIILVFYIYYVLHTESRYKLRGKKYAIHMQNTIEILSEYVEFVNMTSYFAMLQILEIYWDHFNFLSVAVPKLLLLLLLLLLLYFGLCYYLFSGLKILFIYFRNRECQVSSFSFYQVSKFPSICGEFKFMQYLFDGFKLCFSCYSAYAT